MWLHLHSDNYAVFFAKKSSPDKCIADNICVDRACGRQYPGTLEEYMSACFKSFSAGARAALPILVGIVPFGLICGAVCVGTGMPEWAAVGFSSVIYAGASQLVVNQLMAEHASFAVIILTGLVINLRMFMYSASIGPHFRGVHPFRKAVLAYLLTDQAYALSMSRYVDPADGWISKPAYYFGAGLTVWACFNMTTAVGACLGAIIPHEWDLGFAIPLTFIALVVPGIKDKPVALAASLAGVVALAASGLPYNLGLMAGAFVGISVGYAVERRTADG